MKSWFSDLLVAVINALFPKKAPPVPTTTTTTTTTPQPSVPTTTTRPPADQTSIKKIELLNAHNDYRLKTGLSPLIIDSRLMTAASAHSQWMADTGTVSHDGANHSTPFDRIKAAGYNFTRAGENIAAYQRSVNEVMAAWIKSPGHEANIRGNYLNVGFGISTDALGRIYWVVVFATSSSLPHVISEVTMCMPSPVMPN